MITAVFNENEQSDWMINYLRSQGFSIEISNKNSFGVTDHTLFIGQKALSDFRMTIDPYSIRSVEDTRGYPFNYHDKVCMATFGPDRIRKDDQARFCFFRDVDRFKFISQAGIRSSDNIKVADQSNYIELMSQLLSHKCTYSCDIETCANAQKITCIGFATDNNTAYAFPLWFMTPLQASKFFFDALQRPLLGQNCFNFDKPVIRHVLGIDANFTDDLMFLAWEHEKELDKSLGFLGSLYTFKEYHKDMLRKARAGYGDKNIEYIYNGIDCMRTLEIFNNIKEQLEQTQPSWNTSYQLNLRVNEIANSENCYLTLDKKAVKARIKELKEQQVVLQTILNEELGHELNCNSVKQIRELFGKPRFKTVDQTLESKHCLVSHLILLVRHITKRCRQLTSIKPDFRDRIYFANNVIAGPNGEIVSKAPLNIKTIPFGSFDPEDLVIFNERLMEKRLDFTNDIDVKLLSQELKQELEQYGFKDNKHGQRRYFHGRRDQSRTLKEFAEYCIRSEGWTALKTAIAVTGSQLIGIINNVAYFKPKQ